MQRKIEIFIYALGASIIGLIYLYWTTSGYSGNILTNRLVQSYAIYAIIVLYFILLSGALYALVPNLPWKQPWIFTRKPMGVLVAGIATLHAAIAFFNQLGGIPGIPYLSSRYIDAIVISLFALAGFWIMGAMSFASKEFKKTNTWKNIMKIVYLVVVLIVVHALALGTHFRDLRTLWGQFWTGALILLLILEAIRLDRFVWNRLPKLPRINYTLGIVLFLAAWLISPLFASKTPQLLSVHNQHLATSESQSNTKYLVNFSTEKNIVVGEKIKFKLRIYNADTGEPITRFVKLNNQNIHMNIFDASLEKLVDIHPVYSNGEFTDEVTFTANDTYYIYFNFYPSDGVEQLYALNLNLGKSLTPDKKWVAEDIKVKEEPGYKVELLNSLPLKAEFLQDTSEKVKFKLTTASGEEVQDLPYLGALSGLTLINTQTRQLVYGHTTNLEYSEKYKREKGNQELQPDVKTHSHVGETKLRPFELGGPKVEFELVSAKPIEPGIYRMFAKFSPGGNQILVNYTVEIK